MKLFNKKDFSKNGFYVIKNLLNKQEVKKYKDSITKKRYSFINQNAASIDKEGNFKIRTSDTNAFKGYSEYDDEDLWDYVSNPKLINDINELLCEKAYFVHDLGLLDPGSNPNNDSSWHRDSPCRTTGIGPDWDPNIKYNVVTAITYLHSSEDCGTGLNVIPGSHKLSYRHTISNILRYLHLKTRNKKILKFFRELITKLNGVTIKYEAGDCIVFLCTLYHHATLLNVKNKESVYRQCITTRYGGIGKHSNNYIDYVTYKRKEMNKYSNSKKKDQFFDYIKKKGIFTPIPKESKKIDGAYIKK